jgi:hypothetical protein
MVGVAQAILVFKRLVVTTSNWLPKAESWSRLGQALKVLNYGVILGGVSLARLFGTFGFSIYSVRLGQPVTSR